MVEQTIIHLKLKQKWEKRKTSLRCSDQQLYVWLHVHVLVLGRTFVFELSPEWFPQGKVVRKLDVLVVNGV